MSNDVKFFETPCILLSYFIDKQQFAQTKNNNKLFIAVKTESSFLLTFIVF